MKKEDLPKEIPLGRAENIKGQKFNLLTPLYRCEGPSKGKVYWVCQCECGEYTITKADSLKSGHTKSCGCLNSPNLKNKNFGKLVVQYSIPGSRKKEKKWHCLCECGRTRDVSTKDLKSGKVIECVTCTISKDIAGQKFGKLTALYRLNKKNNNGSYYWRCKCDCSENSFIDVPINSLTTGNTKSCGCLNSYWEFKIAELFKNNNISFIPQKTFKDCINPKTGALLRFDFYLPDYNILIEYDGSQHFQEENLCSDTLKDRQFRDNIKNDWVKKNDIIFKRIPYWETKGISLEKLLDDKSYIFKTY